MFDDLNLGVIAGASVAGFIGAATAASVMGPTRVLLAGIGIGVAGLVVAFGELVDRVQAVGAYFVDTREAYLAGEYKYDADAHCLMPLPGPVIQQLDLRANIVTFDSQYL
ncbi:TcdA/TcdB pore forming domain-containing protein [Penicillium sp. IBT 35674x]|nr:TcdA/TcdB pore forming domain-containing protein [Penicillium sp. IBT 35674x]